MGIADRTSTPMKRTHGFKLPSLNALKAFESAGRLLSFTLAAQELNVTQGAVSRQIKTLEEELGVRLFFRHHRRIVLTDKGRMLLAPLSDAFDIIAGATLTLKPRHQDQDLNIKVHPTFAIRWLIPRIHRFQSLYPAMQVRLTTSSVNVDFSKENFDSGITYGTAGADPGTVRKLILRERLTPVCSPSILSGRIPLETPGDLKHHLLLYNNPDQREWRLWAEAAGITDLAFDHGQVFEIDDAAIQAATSGLGIALGDLLLVRDDLRAGRLVQPFDYIPLDTGSYYLACPKSRSDETAITAFRHWLLDEMAQCLEQEE